MLIAVREHVAIRVAGAGMDEKIEIDCAVDNTRVQRIDQRAAGLPAPPRLPVPHQNPWHILLSVKEKRIIEVIGSEHFTTVVRPAERLVCREKSLETSRFWPRSAPGPCGIHSSISFNHLGERSETLARSAGIAALIGHDADAAN